MKRKEIHFVLMATCPDGSDPLVWMDKVVFTERAKFVDCLEFGLRSFVCSILAKRGKEVKFVPDKSECATEGGFMNWLEKNQDKIDLKKLPTEAELMKKIFGKIT